MTSGVQYRKMKILKIYRHGQIFFILCALFSMLFASRVFGTPTILAGDNFNRPNSTNLGTNWNILLGEFSILDNQASAGTNSDFCLARFLGITNANVSIQTLVKLGTSGEPYLGPIARFTDHGNGGSSFYWGPILRVGPSNYAAIFKNTPASGLVLLNYAPIPTNNGNVRLDVVSDQLSLYLGDVLKVTAADSSIPGPGEVGLLGKGASNDNFTVERSFVDYSYWDFFFQSNSSYIGPILTKVLGDFSIQTNRLVSTPFDLSLAVVNAPELLDFQVEADVSVDTSMNGRFSGVLGRGRSGRFYWGALNYLDGNYNLGLYKFMDGVNMVLTNTLLASTGVTARPNLKLVVIGNQQRLYLNKTLRLTANDTSITNKGLVGFLGVGGDFDNCFAKASRFPTNLYSVADLGPISTLHPDVTVNGLGWCCGTDASGRAFLWQNGIKTTLGNSALASTAEGINDLGQVAGDTQVAAKTQGVLFFGTNIFPLATLSSWSESHAFAVNSVGQTVGYAATTNGPVPVLWQGSTVTPLGTPGGFQSRANAITPSGVVVGGSLGKPFVYTSASGMQFLPFLGYGVSDFAVASGVNDSGWVVGSSLATNTGSALHAVCWKSGQVFDLGTIAIPDIGSSSQAIAVNNAGQIVGNASVFVSGNPRIRAFYHDSTYQMQDLNDLIDPASGWTLEFATSINDSGQIAGSGLFGGIKHGFLLTPLH